MINDLAAIDLNDEDVAPAVIDQVAVCRKIVKATNVVDIEHIVMDAHRPSLADFLPALNSARVARHAGSSTTVVRS